MDIHMTPLGPVAEIGPLLVPLVVPAVVLLAIAYVIWQTIRDRRRFHTQIRRLRTAPMTTADATDNDTAPADAEQADTEPIPTT